MTPMMDEGILWPILFVASAMVAAHFALWPLQLHRYFAFMVGVLIVFSPVVWSLWRAGDVFHVALIAVCVIVGGTTAILAESWRLWLERKSGNGTTIRGLSSHD